MFPKEVDKSQTNKESMPYIVLINIAITILLTCSFFLFFLFNPLIYYGSRFQYLVVTVYLVIRSFKDRKNKLKVKRIERISVILALCITIILILELRTSILKSIQNSSIDYYDLSNIIFLIFTLTTDTIDYIGITHVNLLIGIPLLFLSLIIFLLYSFCVDKYLKLKKNENKGQQSDILNFFLNNTSITNIIILIIFYIFMAFSEELIFRFFLINFLFYFFNLNLIFIVISTSIFFALVHYTNFKSWQQVISSFGGGIMICILFIEFGIFYSWLFHTVSNIIDFKLKQYGFLENV